MYEDMEAKLEHFEGLVSELQKKYDTLSARIDRIVKALTDGTVYREIVKESE